MVLKSRMTRRTFAAGALAAAAAPAVIKSANAADSVEIKYMLWDSNQQPAYQACADTFTKANPNIKITIQQLGWDDYWTAIQTGMVSGDLADVFTNHLAKYPELASKSQLVDIQPMVDNDKVPTNIYTGQLADLWSRDGKRYGLPKDWDTISVVYNADMLTAAGVDPKVFDEWKWNPKDGGDLAQLVAKLTLDESGKNGLDPAFNKSKVKQYGLAMGLGDPYGQTGWSLFAASTGWRFMDKPWGTKYNLDDQRLIDTMTQLSSMSLEKGWMAPEDQVTSLKTESMFTAGKTALVFHGSWMINWFGDNTKFKFGFGRLPTGPEARICMFNGLADSIWTGTKHKDEAWAWVKYLASPEAQDIVGTYGVVFPAIPAADQKAKAAWAKKGEDVASYLDQAQQKDGTFLFPIADHASEYTSIMTAAMQSIALGKSSPKDALTKANKDVNKLF
jgi:multiple sugar transport system substrate-binding protein